MTKFLCGLGVLALMAAMLAGCNGNSSSSPMNNQPGTSFSAGNSGPANGNSAAPAAPPLKPERSTEPLESEPHAVAIWVNRENREKSLVYVADPAGAIFSINLDGKRGTLVAAEKPIAGFDVEYDFALSDQVVDLLVAVERETKRLRFYAIDPSAGTLAALGTKPILAAEEGDAGVATGVALFRETNGTTYAIVSTKGGSAAQYRVKFDDGELSLAFVRKLGDAATGVMVDDEREGIYLTGPGGTSLYPANPADSDSKPQPQALASGASVRGALALARSVEGEGFLIGIEPAKSGTRLAFYSRKPAGDKEAAHMRVGTLALGFEAGEELAVTTEPLGADFPSGLIVATNAAEKKLVFFDWRSVHAALSAR